MLRLMTLLLVSETVVVLVVALAFFHKDAETSATVALQETPPAAAATIAVQETPPPTAATMAVQEKPSAAAAKVAVRETLPPAAATIAVQKGRSAVAINRLKRQGLRQSKRNGARHQAVACSLIVPFLGCTN